MLVQKVLDLTVQRARFMKVVIIVGSNVQVPFKISVYPTLSSMRCSRLLRAVSSLPGSERLYKSSRLSC